MGDVARTLLMKCLAAFGLHQRAAGARAFLTTSVLSVVGGVGLVDAEETLGGNIPFESVCCSCDSDIHKGIIKLCSIYCTHACIVSRHSVYIHFVVSQ